MKRMRDMRRTAIASRYHKMSAVEKRALSVARMHDSPTSCPQCDARMMPVDLIPHLEQRCPGRREPGPGARWVPARAAMALQVPRPTLTWWARQGVVRARGPRMDREYLFDDLSRAIARWRGLRRRLAKKLVRRENK